MQLLSEIIVDNFAGGGGASTGIELATGRSVDVAINHDPAAIAMHKVNHPESEHYCESVWDVDPLEVTKGRPVALCWFSPDCKHFSKAKGGKPVQKEIRGLAWVALRWAAVIKPRVIILENVEEFVTWGPITKEGYPDPKQKGRTFKTFVNALKRQGYEVDWKELRACDYGAPTIRKRFFMIARCDGQPIVFPKPTHGDPKTLPVTAKKLKPWRTAAEIIDWAIECPSIFSRKKELADNTKRRIARGLYKFVINNPNPFSLSMDGQGLIVPTMIQTGYGEREGQKPRILDLHKPLGTVVAGGQKHALVTAFLAQYYTETATHDARGQTLNQPIYTIPTANRFGLVTSHLVKFKGQEYGHSLDVPFKTITAGGNNFGEVRAFLMSYYGASIGSELNEPLHTVTTKDRFGLVTIQGHDYRIVDIGMRMLEPHELFAAQGFPLEYIIDRDCNGKSYPKSAQVARCGNAVPPPFANALVRSNLPELCGGHGYKEEHQLELKLV